MWRRSYFFSLVFFVGISASVHEGRCDSAEQVGAALDVMRQWLGDDENAKKWHTFLRTDVISQEIAKGEEADIAPLQEILEVYRGETPGLERRQFAVVGRSLAAWISVLSLPKTEELPELIRSSTAKFTPAEEGKVEETRQALLESVELLEQFLKTVDEKKSAGWKEHLRWDELISELEKEEGPELKALERIRANFFKEHDGLQLPAFVGVRGALREYGEAISFSGERFQQAFEQTLNALANALEACAAEPNHANSSLVGFYLGWLERAGQVPEVVKAVRHHYAKPNLYVQMSELLVGVGFEEDVERNAPIIDKISGASVSGNALTAGKVSSQLVPNIEEGEIKVKFAGTSQSNTRGVSGPVTIIGSSSTSIDASKHVFANDEGFYDVDAAVQCVTNASIDNILGSSAVRSRAWPQARASLPRTELRTARQTERRVSRRIDREFGEAMVDVNNRYIRQFKGPLMRNDEDPGEMRFSTSDDHLFATTAQANAFQVAAQQVPSKLDTEYDLAIHVHESYLNNYVETVYGGTKLTDNQAAQLIEDLTGSVPGQLQRGEDDKPWSITFMRRQPITMVFADQGYTITVRGKRFSSGDRHLGATHVRAQYKFEMTPDGARRIRQGEIHIEPANFATRTKKTLSPGETAEKALLKRRFDDMFPAVIEPDGLELPGRWEKAGRLTLRCLNVENGWLAMEWQQPDQPQEEDLAQEYSASDTPVLDE